ncbi:siderophore-interacting protein [Gallaecimonas mangrovi]|uniref:siderophore-interacting protein n=1 Tax=Gallaecimonas mangrovi TaxID=2291597 RepID=UPI0018681A81|nr:siderophore-interacting protein [Gallaecimonas mangrovi]
MNPVIKNRKPPRLITVHSSTRLTPNMQRVIFSGDNLNDFPEGQEGANFKLLLPQPGDALPDLNAFPAGEGKKPIVRTYTVRRYDAATQQLTVDFALHGDQHMGPASQFAVNAKAGDQVGIAGPGPKKLSTLDADWFLFAADMSAIPAAAAVIEELPQDAKGYAFFEIPSADDKQPIDAPAGLSITWLINPDAQNPSSQQLDAIKAIDWPSGRPSIFAAGEGNTVRALRRYFLDEHNIERKAMYASPYWKIGLTEDQHQVQKRSEKD